MTNLLARVGRGRLVLGASVLAVVAAFGVCEALGWPFLAAPMQRWLGQALERPVAFSEDPAHPRVTLRLLGRVELSAAYLRIGAPSWSRAPHMLLARDARLTLGYADLWRASRGGPLHIRALRAASLDGHIERLADGRASWQFGSAPPPTSAETPPLPTLGLLQVGAGTLAYRDAPLAAQVAATFALVDGATTGADAPPGLRLQASGTYQKQPLEVSLQSDGVLSLLADDAAAVAWPLTLDLRVGGARVNFRGTATDVLNLTALQGRFSVQGSSLAAIGDPLHVTLPTTGPFRVQGLIAKDGMVWKVLTEQVGIGASRLTGAFTYDPRPAVPVLSGRLGGSKLQLADLGPAVGATSAAEPDKPPPGRVLPDRPFDLPALRAMNANVLIDIDTLDLGSSILEPLEPLRTHLVLADGVLSLRDIDARTGQGRLAGQVQLDGRAAQAQWTADLRWSGVRLESWIRQKTSTNGSPFVTGNLSGRARVVGQGKSTAAILGSLQGDVRMDLAQGTVSHLAIEAMGLDVAQALGLLIKGDDALPVQCTVADLVVQKGLLRPRVLVLDTTDSTLWVEGSLSLATEALDLRLVVTPKDFSPLALRAPLRVRGSFADPSISLEAGTLGARLGAAALLGLINPFAALIPLIETGNSEAARRGAEGCHALSARLAARPARPAN